MVEEGVGTEDGYGMFSFWIGRVVEEGSCFGVGWGEGVEGRGGFEEGYVERRS